MTLNNADINITDDHNEDNHEDEVIISFGDNNEGAQSSEDDDANNAESSTIKAIRQQLRQTQQELNQLKSKPVKHDEPIVVGEEPTFEGCDYDPDKFKSEMAAYYDRKSRADIQAKQTESKTQEVIATFNNQVKALGVKDFDLAKQVFNNSFSLDQKNAILTAADNMALIVYALGKQPDKVNQLMEITDPIKLAAAVAKIEKDVKVTKKSNAGKIEPDKVLKGNASTNSPVGNVDKQLEKLREKARATGDTRELMAFKRANKIK